MKKLAILSLLFFVVLSCNKEKRYSHKLMKGETWEVERITVDGNIIESASLWSISKNDMYDSVPTVTWNGSGSNQTFFEWQFQEEGKKFQLNYVQLCAECEGIELDELDYLCYDITGSYDVERHKRSEMIFKSTNTLSYPNKMVEIKVVRKK